MNHFASLDVGVNKFVILPQNNVNDTRMQCACNACIAVDLIYLCKTIAKAQVT